MSCQSSISLRFFRVGFCLTLQRRNAPMTLRMPEQLLPGHHLAVSPGRPRRARARRVTMSARIVGCCLASLEARRRVRRSSRMCAARGNNGVVWGSAPRCDVICIQERMTRFKVVGQIEQRRVAMSIQCSRCRTKIWLAASAGSCMVRRHRLMATARERSRLFTTSNSCADHTTQCAQPHSVFLREASCPAVWRSLSASRRLVCIARSWLMRHRLTCACSSQARRTEHPP